MRARIRSLLRATAWPAAVALVVLGTHVLAYALAPRPTLVEGRLEYGSSLSYVPGAVALVLAVAGSCVVLRVVAVAVAERARLESAAFVDRISAGRTAVRAIALSLSGLPAFAGFESYVHWRDGLGWHGLECLIGPVHRNAIPIVLALSALVAAAGAAAEHVRAWMRRLVSLLRPDRPAVLWSAAVPEHPAASPEGRSRSCSGALGARAPPRPVDGSARSTIGRRHATMKRSRMWRSSVALGAGSLVALVLAGGAWAHAEISPPVTLAKAGQLFTLAVPTEEEDATTTKIELTPPAGFSIDSFVPAVGWKRDVQQTGSGEDTVVQKVTWSGGSVPTEEDAVFQFVASADSSKTYEFAVRQTYSNGKVVDWSGPESSDTPAPRIEAKGSLGGGSSSTLAIVALIVGAIGVLLGIVSLAGGKRQLA